MNDTSQVGEVRRFVQKMASEFDFNEVESGRLSIIVNELGNNLVKYAPGGKLLVRSFASSEFKQVEVLSVDSGPGMDVDLAMTDGYSTGRTPGTGLGSVKRQADYFDLYSDGGKGTVIVAGVLKGRSKSPFDFGVVNQPYSGEAVCGDDYYLSTNEDLLSVLVVDGLGHGLLASQAANDAVAEFAEKPHESLDILMNSIHRRLKSTRGGAVFILKWHLGQVSFTGVGNIRAFIQRPFETRTLISQNGTAGVQIRTPKVLSEKWDGEGLLILHSDGIMNRCDLSNHPGLLYRHPAVVAGVIYRDFNRGNDDATVVVIGRRK